MFHFLLSKSFYAVALVAHLNLLRLLYPEPVLTSTNIGDASLYNYFSSLRDVPSGSTIIGGTEANSERDPHYDSHNGYY
jgi:hypothetical protein